MKFFNKKEDVAVETEPEEIIMYTEEQLMARLKFFIGICLALTLVGIVFVVLYSLIFVTQPMNAISPMDQKFFELIIPIATFLTGTLSGIMLAGGDKDLRAKALDAANKAPSVSPSPTPSSGGPGGFNASANFGGSSFSFNKAPAATSASSSLPSAFGAAPAAAGAAGAALGTVAMSSTGKPMPAQEDDEEL
jgi:hypothetical protein